MSPRITLSVRDSRGRERRATISGDYFTIGRGRDNDLVVDDELVSSRHVVIASFAGTIQVADCGALNGTFVNEKPVDGSFEVVDGDVIRLGPRCNVRVSIGEAEADAEPDPPAPPSGAGTRRLAAPRRLAPVSVAPPQKRRISAVAISMTLLLLVATGVGIGSLAAVTTQETTNHEPRTTNHEPQVSNNEQRTTNNELPPADSGQRTADPLDRAATIVMSRISNDSTPYALPARAESDVSAEVERYKASGSLARTLRSLEARGADAAAAARRAGVEPDLVLYAALAETDGGQTGRDPLAAAHDMLPQLAALRTTFGSETADSSLLVVAAYGMGASGSGSSHPLFLKLKSASNDPANDRSVWYLHERGALDARAYGFVLRFLALGAIAQNPRQFGVDADPLAF